MVKVAPSILSADFANLGRDIERIQEAGCDWVHLDVMDGQFVPNMSFGMPIIKAVKAFKKVPYDAHLMIENPENFIEKMRDAGADIITVHAEASKHLDRLVQQIRSTGAMAGIALNPATPISAVEEILGEIDLILIMSVNPGFGGQKYIKYVTDKIRRVSNLRTEKGYTYQIEVDGGIDDVTGKLCVDAGADVLVAGSYVFNNGIDEPIKKLHSL